MESRWSRGGSEDRQPRPLGSNGVCLVPAAPPPSRSVDARPTCLQAAAYRPSIEYADGNSHKASFPRRTRSTLQFSAEN